MTVFSDRLAEAVRRAGSPACVGLDPHLDHLPMALRVRLSGLSGAAWRAAAAAVAREFCLGAVEAARGVVPAVKPQVAFFEVLGAAGVAALEDVCDAAKEAGLLVVLDAKRGDIGTTAEAYARGTLDDDGPIGADAVTLSPYLGPESLAPFVKRCERGKGLFLLVRTSNPGAEAWQADGADPIAGRVADWIERESAARAGASNLGPIGAVVGATLPAEAAAWRERMPHAWLLVPGYGAQGATAADIRGQMRADGLGALINSARAVLFPAKGDDGDAWREGIAARAKAFAAELREIRP
jgi:orotidine-5'-phosphate decarboxylase